MAIPILTRRRERRQSEMITAIESGIEKALSPAIAGAAAAGISGATYPMFNANSPFSQTAGGGGGGMPVPLPRPEGTFDSLFGPGFPLWPDPLDPIGSNGRTQLRRGEYPVTWNIQLVDRVVPWSLLTYVAKSCDVVNKCIMVKQDEITGYEWSFGFSKQILQQIMADTGETNTARATELARDKYGAELDKVSKFFERPDKRMNFTFSQWMTEAIFNIMTYDGWVVYPQYSLGGDLLSLSNIDTQTIKVLRDNQGFVPLPPAPAYQQILYGFPRNETQAEDPTNPNVAGEWLRDQLAYYIRRPMPHQVYGFSPVEEVLPLAEIYLARQKWLASEYTHGMTPRLLIETAGTENWTPEQLAFYQQIVNDQLSGQIQRRQQAFLLRPGMTATQLTSIDETYKNEYDAFLIGQIGSRFGVPATQLGIQARSGLSGGKQMQGEQQQSEAYSSAALINYLIDCINDLARRFLGIGPEITATCTQLNDEEDNVQSSTADSTDVGAGLVTRNEVRAKRGLPLIDEPEADQLGVSSASGVSFLSGTLATQQAGQEAAQHMAANGQVPGATQPGQPANGAASGTNSGLQSSDSGTGKTSGKDSGSAGPGPASGSSSKPPVKQSQNDKSESGTGATKELAAFAKFIKARTDRTWRDFRFDAVDGRLADFLNEAGRDGDFELIKEALDALKGREDTPKDVESTERLMTYWAEGPGAAKLHWGVPGDFEACRAELGKYVHDPDELAGLCANLHHRATGAWPGHAPGESKKAAGDDEAVIDYSGRIVLPQPLQPGDKVVIEHKSGKDDDYDLEDVDDLEKDTQTVAGGELLNELHDKLVDHFSPLLADAMQDADGITAAINAARKAATAKKD